MKVCCHGVGCWLWLLVCCDTPVVGLCLLGFGVVGCGWGCVGLGFGVGYSLVARRGWPVLLVVAVAVWWWFENSRACLYYFIFLIDCQCRLPLLGWLVVVIVCHGIFSCGPVIFCFLLSRFRLFARFFVEGLILAQDERWRRA